MYDEYAHQKPAFKAPAPAPALGVRSLPDPPALPRPQSSATVRFIRGRQKAKACRRSLDGWLTEKRKKAVRPLARYIIRKYYTWDAQRRANHGTP